MSDFDKFFADKLEEEGDFPHRDRNWKQLSQRLQAFESGGGGQPSHWHYWPAAVAVAVSLTVAGWLLWKMQIMQRENTALRQEVATLRHTMPMADPTATLPEKNAPLPAVSEKSMSRLIDQSTFPPPTLLVRPPYSKSKKNPSSTKAAATVSPSRPQQKRENKAADRTIVQSDIASVASKKTGLNLSKLVDSIITPVLDIVSALTYGSKDKMVPPTKALPSAVLPDSLYAAVPTQDSARAILAKNTPDTTAATLPALLPDSMATAIAPPIIEPVRPPARFRIGVEAVAGRPLRQEPGISPIFGSGITATYAPWQFLRLTASADWLHFDVSTSRYRPQYHAPRYIPPMHTHGHDELVQVESQQRQQHFALGLTYALPVRGWLRPAVRVMHNWVRIAPGLVSFKYEETQGGPGPGPGPGPGHHDPEYIVKKFDGQMLSNIWRIGAGIEHERANWTIGLWLDYSRSLAATASTFDALMVRGGVQYKF